MSALINPCSIAIILWKFIFVCFCFHRNVIEPMILILVGNKIDLEKQRAVSREEAFLYASSINGSYYETSAINGGRGIEQVFISTARGLLQLAENSDCSSIKRYESTDSILSCSDINGNSHLHNLYFDNHSFQAHKMNFKWIFFRFL